MGFFNGPLLDKREYSEETYIKKKRKICGGAKRIVIMSILSLAFGVNAFVSLGLFLVILLGIDALVYFLNFNINCGPETAILRGGLFGYLTCIFMILFAITGFWYAIEYVVLQIRTIHLDGLPKYDVEQEDVVEEDIEEDEVVTQSEYSSIGNAISTAEKYMIDNDINIAHINILQKTNKFLIICQIITAIVCVVMLMKN